VTLSSKLGYVPYWDHKASNMATNWLRITLLSLLCFILIAATMYHIRVYTCTTYLPQFQQLSLSRDKLTQQRDDISRRLNSLQVNRYDIAATLQSVYTVVRHYDDENRTWKWKWLLGDHVAWPWKNHGGDSNMLSFRLENGQRYRDLVATCNGSPIGNGIRRID